MVTLLDLGLLQHFSGLFPVVFVWVVVFAVLDRFKWPSESKALNSFLSLVIALMLLFSPKALEVMNFMTPWFVIAIVFFIMLFLVFMLFGVKEEQFFNVVKNEEAVHYSIIVIALLLLVAAIGKVYFTAAPGEAGLGAAFVSSAAGVGEAAFFATIFHPKVLGFALITVIALFAVRMLSGNANPK